MCCEVLTNVLYNLSRAGARTAVAHGRIVERLYDERSGLFGPAGPPVAKAPPGRDLAALAPLALPDLPEAIGRRLVEEHLLDPKRFWLPVPPPSVSAAEPSFSPEEVTLFRAPRYWRGPTWVNSAWLVWLGLVRLGYRQQAAELVARLGADRPPRAAARVLQAVHGAGMGAYEFGWSSLIWR